MTSTSSTVIIAKIQSYKKKFLRRGGHKFDWTNLYDFTFLLILSS